MQQNTVYFMFKCFIVSNQKIRIDKLVLVFNGNVRSECSVPDVSIGVAASKYTRKVSQVTVDIVSAFDELRAFVLDRIV